MAIDLDDERILSLSSVEGEDVPQGLLRAAKFHAIEYVSVYAESRGYDILSLPETLMESLVIAAENIAAGMIIDFIREGVPEEYTNPRTEMGREILEKLFTGLESRVRPRSPLSETSVLHGKTEFTYSDRYGD